MNTQDLDWAEDLVKNYRDLVRYSLKEKYKRKKGFGSDECEGQGEHGRQSQSKDLEDILSLRTKIQLLEHQNEDLLSKLQRKENNCHCRVVDDETERNVAINFEGQPASTGCPSLPPKFYKVDEKIEKLQFQQQPSLRGSAENINFDEVLTHGSDKEVSSAKNSNLVNINLLSEKRLSNGKSSFQTGSNIAVLNGVNLTPFASSDEPDENVRHQNCRQAEIDASSYRGRDSPDCQDQQFSTESRPNVIADLEKSAIQQQTDSAVSSIYFSDVPPKTPSKSSSERAFNERQENANSSSVGCGVDFGPLIDTSNFQSIIADCLKEYNLSSASEIRSAVQDVVQKCYAEREFQRLDSDLRKELEEERKERRQIWEHYLQLQDKVKELKNNEVKSFGTQTEGSSISHNEELFEVKKRNESLEKENKDLKGKTCQLIGILEGSEAERDSDRKKFEQKEKELEERLKNFEVERHSSELSYKATIRSLILELDELKMRNLTFQNQLTTITAAYHKMFGGEESSDITE